MNVRIPNIIRWHPVMSAVLACAVIGSSIFSYNYYKTDSHKNNIPASLIGVHHLGSDYLIDHFYIDKHIGDSISEGGGGGSTVCCVMLPKEWNPKLKVDVRWEVRHIIRTADPSVQETAEVEGIYQAQVPVESYTESGDFYVHFFPKGRVRIVVTPISADGEQHPIQDGDKQASQRATAGLVIKSLFTSEEIAEFEREIIRDRKKYGDWR